MPSPLQTQPPGFLFILSDGTYKLSHLPWYSPHGLVFWQHGGLRRVTLLYMVTGLQRKEYIQSAGSLVGYNSKLAQVTWAIFHGLKPSQGPSRFEVGGDGLVSWLGVTGLHCRRPSDRRCHCSYVWKRQHVTCAASGTESSRAPVCPYSSLCFPILESTGNGVSSLSLPFPLPLSLP